MLLVTLPLAAQSEWTSFAGEDRAELEEAIRTLDAWHASSGERVRDRYLEIQDLYAAARRDRSPPAEYADALDEAGIGRPTVPEDVVSARARVEDAFALDTPIPGTRAFARAREWLRSLADGEGYPTGRFLSLVDALQQSLGGLSPADVELLTGSIAVPGYAVPESISPEDRVGEAVLVWSLRVLAAGDPERVRLLESFSRTLSRLDTELERGLVSGLDELAADRRELVRLERATAISPPAYALASVLVFADPERTDGLVPGLQELVAALESLAAAPLPAAVVVYDRHAHVAFLVDTADSLFASASELQRYRFAERVGLHPAHLRRLRVALHRLRDAANEPVSPPEPPAAVAGRAAFEDFLREGADYVTAAEPWAEGERSRSGDAYRWAMLPILSHPYAQYMVATLPELASTREMVDGFATGVYEEAARRSGVSPGALVPVVVGDAVAPYARVYRTSRQAAADSLYDAFAATAQGVEELSRDFAVAYTAGLTVAGYWSHTHGLHVAVVDDAEVPDRVRARVDDWFALARSADTVEEEIALTSRGLIALRRVVRDELDPVLVASGVPSAAMLDPRLPSVLALLDEAATFARDPLEVRDALALLFDVGPGSAGADALTDAIAQALEAVVTRLRDVEIPDRRLLERRARVEAER